VSSDNFDRADATTLGASWTTLKGLVNSLGIFSNQVDVTSTGTASGNYWSADAAPDNQLAVATVVAVAARTQGVVVRAITSGSTQNQYLGGHDNNQTGNTRLRIWKMVGGVRTDLASHATENVTAGTVLKLEAIGTTLNLYVDGVLKVTTTDPDLTAGQPGLMADHGTLNVAIWDDWSGGGLVLEKILTEVLPLVDVFEANPPGPSGKVQLNFGPWPGTGAASRLVINQAAIVATSKVDAWIHPSASADHSTDEHFIEPIRVRAGDIVAGGGFTIHGELIQGRRTYGLWNVAFAWRTP
jgi:hypothetical protein